MWSHFSDFAIKLVKSQTIKRTKRISLNAQTNQSKQSRPSNRRPNRQTGKPNQSRKPIPRMGKPNGQTGKQTYPPNGQTKRANGQTKRANGQTKRANGQTKRANGQTKWANQTGKLNQVFLPYCIVLSRRATLLFISRVKEDKRTSTDFARGLCRVSGSLQPGF